MSALISTKGITYDLIFNERIRLYAPEFLLDEIEKYKNEILEKSGLNEEEFNLVLAITSSKIEFIPISEFIENLEEAEKISPDINDREYFALAMKLNCPIWSNDKKLKEQNKIKVYSTDEIIEMR